MGKSIGYITRESALIVFSILIALGVNEWRMRVADEAEKQRALAAVYAELVDNLEIVEGLPEYHGAIAQAKRDIGLDADVPLHDLWAIRFLLKETR